MTERYGIYVPKDGVTHGVRAASAIVGEMKAGMVDTHYEGGGHHSNVTTFEHRINQAAGRRRQDYPTSARRGWREEDLIHAGHVSYDEAMQHWVIDEIVDVEALRAWVGADEPLVEGGSDALVEETGSRGFSRLPPEDQARIMGMRLPMTALCAEVLATLRRNAGAPPRKGAA